MKASTTGASSGSDNDSDSDSDNDNAMIAGSHGTARARAVATVAATKTKCLRLVLNHAVDLFIVGQHSIDTVESQVQTGYETK
jgi:hypothetical protein